MERPGFNNDLEKLLNRWKEYPSEQIIGLRYAILFARTNGIDLVLKIPKSVLRKTGPIKPISENDATMYSSDIDKNNFIFNIPSDFGIESIQRGKRFKLEILNYRDFGPSVLIKSDTLGVFGVFLPDEVASIDVK